MLAVEIHQQSVTSSDISFNLQLAGVPRVPLNQPPLVSLISPTNNEIFLAPAGVLLEAGASDADGGVTRVEFLANGVVLGEATNAPYSFTWSNPPVGLHLVQAVATDNEGAKAWSGRTIRIYDSVGTPIVQIIQPVNGAVFQDPTNLFIRAEVSALAAISNVQVFANGLLIGEGNLNPYSLVWSNVPFGTNSLMTVAFDAQGLAGTSSVVSVIILPPPDNTIAPVIFTTIPASGASLTNLTSIQVTFSERVVGVNAADLLVNEVPASGVSGSGSNYTFTVAQPAYGTVAITWATNHGITDVGIPPLPFDATASGATWTYTLLDAVPPTVASRTPAANTTVTNLTQVTVTFSEPVGGVDATDFRVNGISANGVSSLTNTAYTFTFNQPPSGLVTISWDSAHGITDLAVTPNAFNGSNSTWSYTLDARTILVQSNANWLFIKGLAEASAPAAAWRAPVFNDSGWSNSPAPFYYGDPYNTTGIPGTLLSDMQNNYTSIYLRGRFVVPDLNTVTNLLLTAQSDDGFIAWINGVEVVRFNLPAGEVPYNAVTLASTTEPNGRGAPYLSYTLPDPAGYLVEGTNIIAIHAFNRSLTASSDFGFNAQFYTYLADPGAAAPRVATVSPEPGEVFSLTNFTVTFTEPVSGVDAGDLLVNGTPALNVFSPSNTTFTFSFAQPPFGTVVFTWDTNHGIADFDAPPKPFNADAPGSIFQFDLLNPSSPVVITQSPPAGSVVANLTQVIVTFSEAVTNVDAFDLLINGLSAAMVSGAGAEYTFTFAQPPYGLLNFTWATNHGIQDLDAPQNDFDPTRPGETWSYAHVDSVPSVALINPANGAVFQTPVNLMLQAVAADSDGFITRVEFFDGTNKLGEDTIAPFTLPLLNAPGGSYSLNAVATDSSGLMATSAPSARWPRGSAPPTGRSPA